LIVIRTILDFTATLWLIIAGTIGTILLLIGKIFNDKGKWGMLFIKNVFAPIAFKILGVSVVVTGMDRLDQNKGYVFTANHESHLDTPAIYMIYPKILYFIAKAELRKAPVVGWFISLSGMLFVDRSDPVKAKESIANAARMIRNGKNIISFPEGSRTKTGEIGRFKKGLFQLAKDTQTDVVPVTVSGAREIWPAGTFKSKAGTIKIHFSTPIPHDKFGDDAIALANHVRELIVKKKQTL